MSEPRFGINIPQFHPEDSAELLHLGKFAMRAESLGFDSLWTLDGIFRDAPFLEPLSSLAFLAATTNRVKLGTAVLMIPLRVPAIIAKFTATVDFLSSGRLILGAALGGTANEFAATGVPMNERVARFTEGIKIMRMLWTETHVKFKGRFWQLEDVTVSPKPAQAGGIPIWIGGSQVGEEVNEKAIERAARIGDGWLGAGSTELAAHERASKRFVELARKCGRDPRSLALAKRVYIHVDSDRERAKTVLKRTLSAFYGRSIDVDRICVYGTERDCIGKLSHLREAGTKTLIFHPVVDHFGQAEVVARDLVPRLS